MKIALAADHGGFQMKEALKAHLIERGIEILDLGTDSEASVPYPVYGKACGEAVASGQADRGILVCGTGIGMSMSANKVNGIRAAAVSEPYSAKLTRTHNDANVLCMGARVVGSELAKMIVDSFLDAEFEGGRHKTRVDLMTDIEKRN